METVTSAVYGLEFDRDGIVRDSGDRVFDPVAYSRMKYGSRPDTKRFARDVTDVIVQDMPEIVEADRPPLFLVAYKAVQPACGYLSRYSLDLINKERVENGLEPGEIVKVHKGQVTATDYARATAAERQAELNGIDFSLRGADIAEASAIVLDDIRISGGAERRILEVVNQAERLPARLMLGYVALFNAAQASQAPHVEGEINATAIKTPRDVADLMVGGEFDLNIRTLKLILSAEPSDLEYIIGSASAEQLEAIVRGARDTGPDFIRKYADSYAYLSAAQELEGDYATA